ncbi:hypothetical protein [Proteocatella sphenisci]|uniref:hypothetical protein n=1 Tax=Proteocatella sphenisci TaxID=181070 RepID=UPI000491CF19|nr:hypothetical protein [Proteocatella sphenisci]
MSDNNVQDIMVLLKKKQNHIEQIYSYTVDMEKSASQNDTDTISLLLGMRYSLMTEVEGINEKIESITQALLPLERMRVKAQMSQNHISSETSFEESKIYEIYNSTRDLLEKIIESDRKLNLKIQVLSKLSAIESV